VVTLATICIYLLELYEENDLNFSNVFIFYFCLQHDDEEQYETVSQSIIVVLVSLPCKIP